MIRCRSGNATCGFSAEGGSGSNCKGREGKEMKTHSLNWMSLGSVRVFIAIFKIGSLASLCMLGVGCYSPVVATSRQPISSRSTNDFEFVRLANPSKSDVDRRLGNPDEYFPDLRVAVYPINTVIRRRLTLFLFILPVGGFRDYDFYDIACIEFDEHDNARRCDVILRGSYSLKSQILYWAAKDWLENRDKEKPN